MMTSKVTWRRFHRWAGLIGAVFVLLFCLSGIILNHRSLFAGCDISRGMLPGAYRLDRYNNGIIKGTLPLSSDSLLAYGNAGIWLTSPRFTRFSDFNGGLPSGADRRNIRNIIRLKDGSLWAAAQYGVFTLRGSQWTLAMKPADGERIADITLSPDSMQPVVLTRSAICLIDPVSGQTTHHTIGAPADREPRVTLFKTFWMLHSGELFGTPGRVVVDLVAVIIIFLTITGIILFCLPYQIRRKVAHSNSAARLRARFRWNYIVHDKVGYVTALLTVIIAATGMCLRPPLMIPLVMTDTAPVPGTAQDTGNYWHDKMRGIRWDSDHDRWLLSTSEGFVWADSRFPQAPQPVEGATPPVSPMGITVFERLGTGQWLIGSFSGLYRWDMPSGIITDHTTGEPYQSGRTPYATSPALVAGLSRDLVYGDIVIFDYARGNDSLPPMSARLREQPMSLWNAALELHVGRCYAPFLGPFSSLFVFISGLLLTLLLVSGIIIHLSCKHKQKNNQQNQTITRR